MAPSTKVDTVDAEKTAQDAMDAGDLGEKAEILGTRVESTGAVIAVTSAGVKARIQPDGEVEHLVGPQAAPDIYEPPEFMPREEDVVAGAEDLPPLEGTGPDAAAEGGRAAELEERTVTELQEMAAELDVEGRSSLKKADLVAAIVEAEEAAAAGDGS